MKLLFALRRIKSTLVESKFWYPGSTLPCFSWMIWTLEAQFCHCDFAKSVYATDSEISKWRQRKLILESYTHQLSIIPTLAKFIIHSHTELCAEPLSIPAKYAAGTSSQAKLLYLYRWCAISRWGVQPPGQPENLEFSKPPPPGQKQPRRRRRISRGLNSRTYKYDNAALHEKEEGRAEHTGCTKYAPLLLIPLIFPRRAAVSRCCFLFFFFGSRLLAARSPRSRALILEIRREEHDYWTFQYTRGGHEERARPG